MEEQKEEIYMTYNFGLNSQVGYSTVYQTIYLGHFHGTTFVIHAKMKPEYQNKKKDSIIALTCDFISNNVDGKIFFALHDIKELITFNEDRSTSEIHVHEMHFKLKIFNNEDYDFDPIKLEFEKPFDIKKGELRIQILDKDIVNLKDGMINPYRKTINDDRSCNTKLNGGG